MYLGATVCQPGRPKCLLCPVAEFCAVGEPDMAAPLPLKSPKSEKPTRRGIAFWITDVQRRLLLRRRPERGLLGGMMEVPSTEWREDGWAEAEAQLHAPLFADWRPLPAASATPSPTSTWNSSFGQVKAKERCPRVAG